MTIDRDSQPPSFLRREPIGEPDVQERAWLTEPLRAKSIEIAEQASDLERLKALEKALNDPLETVARQLRALTLEQITVMCKGMNKPEMRDTLVQWAVSYLDGTEMPKDERRF